MRISSWSRSPVAIRLGAEAAGRDGYLPAPVGAAWLLGHFAHNYRGYAARLEERTAELERAREELARWAVVEERLRLARELHDVVADAMSGIAVQSGVGAHVADTWPEEVGKALAAIEATRRSALTELRRLLGVLRQDSEPPGSLAPVPGLADLEGLLAEVAKAGLAVKLQIHETRPPLPAGVDLWACPGRSHAVVSRRDAPGWAAPVVARHGGASVTTDASISLVALIAAPDAWG